MFKTKEAWGKLQGLITQYELLTARDHILQEEHKRERILKMWSIYKYGNLNRLSGFFSSPTNAHQAGNAKDVNKKL